MEAKVKSPASLEAKVKATSQSPKRSQSEGAERSQEEGASSDEESGPEDPVKVWAGGQAIKPSSKKLVLSDTARGVFKALTGRDKEADDFQTAFKKNPDYSKVIKYYTSDPSMVAFTPQKTDQAIPALVGWKREADEKLVKKASLGCFSGGGCFFS